jgi:hypothetical protein
MRPLLYIALATLTAVPLAQTTNAGETICPCAIGAQIPSECLGYPPLMPEPDASYACLIWDGAFTTPQSDVDGPGGRWSGEHPHPTAEKLLALRQVEVETCIVENGHLRIGDPTGTHKGIDVEVEGLNLGRLPAQNLALYDPDHFLTLTFKVRRNPNDSDDTVKILWGVRTGESSDKYQFNQNITDQDCEWTHIAWSLRIGDLIGDELGCFVRPYVKFISANGDSIDVDDLHIQITTTEQFSSKYLDWADPHLEACSLTDPGVCLWQSICCAGRELGSCHWQGGGTSPFSCEDQGCPGDATGDGRVDVNDVLQLLNLYGAHCNDPGVDALEFFLANRSPTSDNGQVIDVNDLLVVLADWGCDS